MLVYLPPIEEDFLNRGPGATGFAPEDESETSYCYPDTTVPEVPSYAQGYRVSPTDLNVIFMDGRGSYISPYSLTYSVGFLSGTDLLDFHPIGNSERIPAGIRTGIFHPNFQVGDKWVTGEYLILWKYQITAESSEETKETLFKVSSAGFYDVQPQDAGLSDIPATVVIIGD